MRASTTAQDVSKNACQATEILLNLYRIDHNHG
jgi:hypothetical protein